MNRYHMAAIQNGKEVQELTIEARKQDEALEKSWEALGVDLNAPGTPEDRNPNGYSLRMKSHENNI